MSLLPGIGTHAPDFTLPSTSGSNVTLSALRGNNVLLAFFPLAFTRVCTAELCAFSEDYGEYEGADTVVLPISVDSVPALKVFKAQEQMKVDLLSDFKREVSRQYGTLLEDRFHSSRAYVLIDRNGVVRWTHEEETSGKRRENAEIIEQIRKLN
jgi:peroxiredoxin